MKYGKIIGLLLAGVMAVMSLMPSAVCAQPFAPHKGPYLIRLDGRELKSEKAKVYANKEGQLMLPLRLLAEAMKYQVSWNKAENTAEITKEGSKKLRVKIGEDCSYYGDSGPLTTGVVTECSEGITYVSMYFVQVFFNAQVKLYEGGQIVITSKIPRDYGILGFVKAVNITEGGSTLLIEGTALGKSKENIIVLDINDNTKIINPITDAAVALEALKVGDMVRGFFGPEIAESYPPKAKAMLLEVIGDARLRVGKITEVDSDGNRILVTDSTGDRIWINITENTRIVNIDGNKIVKFDLTVGKEIEVYHSGAMTKSLPPSAEGLKIVKLGSDLLI